MDRYDDEKHPRIDEAERRVNELENTENEKYPKITPSQYKETITEKPTIIIPKKFDFEPEIVFVKGGTFKMGSNQYDSEKPIHDVTLSDFSIGKYPVTQAQWQAVMRNNPSHFKGDDLPVENVSWDECQVFVTRLYGKIGKIYRLPTEAECEFAARGGNESKGYQYSGSNNIDEVAWYGKNSENMTHPIGTKKANELGIHDMSGNVWEWCSDWYCAYDTAAVANPTGADTGTYRVYRGGSWADDAVGCRIANRNSLSPAHSHRRLGFRLVASFQ